MISKNLLSRFLLFIFMMILIDSAFFPAPAKAGKTKVIRLVVPAAAGDPLTVKDEELAKRFNARVNGQYKIQVFPGESLARIPEFFDAVRVGAIEMADVAWGIYAGADPRLSLIETPFLFNNIEAGTAAAKRLLPLHDKILQERFNAKALGLIHFSGIELITRKPVTNLKEWKGMMVGAISPAMARMIQDLGGSPVTVMWTDLYTSLQKGVIDGTANGTHGSIENGLLDVTSDITYFFGAAAWNGYTINLDLWKGMPPDVQQILIEESGMACEWMEQKLVEYEKEDLEAFIKAKKRVHIISEEERELWRKRLLPYQKQQIESMGEFGQKVKEIADDVNSKYPYRTKTLSGE
ncbi:MAG: TRAP transporter substrate-binding protein DctP [Deltaproteobacteria bacterium]|nr:TRAP transporter substrate-binding protein DctP [Deltaproteobacteria bacterium]